MAGRSLAPGIFLKLSAGSSANVKPEMVLDAYCKETGQELSEFAFLIQREELYARQSGDAESTEGDVLIPLDAVGEEIS